MKKSLVTLILLTTVSIQSAQLSFFNLIRTHTPCFQSIRKICTNSCSKTELIQRHLENKRDRAINKAKSDYQKWLIYNGIKPGQKHEDTVRYNARRKKEMDIKHAWQKYEEALIKFSLKNI